MFLSVEGGDGSGKSTQIDLLVGWLRNSGYDVVTCRDPGSTPLGESVREILLHRHDLDIHRTSEMLLYMAARAQMVDEIIRPAIEAGKAVVSDRFLLSNVVYQGHAGGLDVDTLWEVGRIATGGMLPDLSFVLDVPLDVAQSRMNRSLDRMELQGDSFHEKVRQGFLAEAEKQPEHIIVIDASQDIDAVHHAVRSAVERFCR